MSSQLRTNLELALQEKTEKIIPENIKLGVTIFGVEGTCGNDCATMNTTVFVSTSTSNTNAVALVGAIKKLPDKFQLSYSGYYAFHRASSLEELPSGLDLSVLTSLTGMCCGCSSLKEFLIEDTGCATDMSSMFEGCTSLVYVARLNTQSITSYTAMKNMFKDCPNLSDESLNNIMGMCIDAVNFPMNYPGYTKLSALGLTSEQATRCQSLSNYQAFIAAGWTTGY